MLEEAPGPTFLLPLYFGRLVGVDQQMEACSLAVSLSLCLIETCVSFLTVFVYLKNVLGLTDFFFTGSLPNICSDQEGAKFWSWYSLQLSAAPQDLS